MKTFSEKEIKRALKDIENMDHFTMCRLWRFGSSDNIYFRNDLPTSEAFRNRLFNHFGGFTVPISKELGWQNG